MLIGSAPNRSDTPNRRDALKSRHREAILAAALSLVTERGGPGFNVDELATRADVARRTIFNHFSSVDEILVTLCGDALDVLVDEFVATVAATPVGDGTRESMFHELAESFRASDLPAAIATIVSILGAPGTDHYRESTVNDQAFAHAGDRLLAEVQRRHPAADAFETELLVGSLVNGVTITAKRWIQTCGVQLNPTGRAEWQRLLDRFIFSMRTGYLPSS